MKYILEFENWVSAVKEGFDAKIEDDNDPKDEIEIEAPNEANTIKYVVDKDDNVKSKKIISTDNGEQEEIIVNDKQLENDIIDAVDKINDIKNRVEAKELRRLTGGDRSTDSETVKQIKKIFKDGKNTGKAKYICKCKGFMSFLKGSSEHNWFHLDISKINGKYNIDKENVYYTFKPKKGVGKGEYLLPLLFDDVHKQKIHGENTKGDNFIEYSENNETHRYYLELKAPNASLGFRKNIRDYLEENLPKYNDKQEMYKTEIVVSIMEYAKKLKSSWENLYMCIFGKTDSPKDILFINLSEIENNDTEPNINTKRSPLFKEIFNMITIDNIGNYNTSNKTGKTKKDIAYSFSFTYNGDKSNPIINCKLKSETIQDIHIESNEQ